jgi:hypothetical protein
MCYISHTSINSRIKIHPSTGHVLRTPTYLRSPAPRERRVEAVCHCVDVVKCVNWSNITVPLCVHFMELGTLRTWPQGRWCVLAVRCSDAESRGRVLQKIRKHPSNSFHWPCVHKHLQRYTAGYYYANSFTKAQKETLVLSFFSTSLCLLVLFLFSFIPSSFPSWDESWCF